MSENHPDSGGDDRREAFSSERGDNPIRRVVHTISSPSRVFRLAHDSSDYTLETLTPLLDPANQVLNTRHLAWGRDSIG
jgi:hypothetical protein